MKNFISSYKGSYVSYCMAVFFFFFTMSTFVSILGVYLTGIGKTPAEMSFIISASGMFSIIFTPLIGYLNDRVKKPKRLVLLVLSTVGVLGLVFAFVMKTWLLFLLNGIIMVGISSMAPILDRMLGFCKYRYGTIRVWGTLGFACATQLAGIILQYLPHYCLFLMMFITAVITVANFFATDDRVPGKISEVTAEKEKVSGLFKNKYLILYLLIVFIFIGSNGVHMTYLPILLGEMDISLTLVGTILFLGTVTEIPMIFFSNKFMDKYTGRTLIIVAHILLLASLVFYAFVSNIAVIILVTFLLKAIPSMLFSMLNLKVIVNLVNGQLATTALAISSSCMSLGSIVLQNISGPIASSFNTQTVYVFLSAVVIVGLILAVFLKVPNEKKMFAK